MATPFQSEVLAKNRAELALARKKRYRNLVGLGLGGAGFAVAFAGLPISVSLVLWLAGFAAWALLKAA